MSIVNPQPWPVSMREKFGDDLFVVINALRKAPSVELALNYLIPYGLTEDEMAIALQKVQPSMSMPKRLPPSVSVTKANFYAAAWKVGAAYRQIARVLGISHQTVYSLARRVLGNNPVRSVHGISDEQCEAIVHDWRRDAQRTHEQMVSDFSHILSTWQN